MTLASPAAIITFLVVLNVQRSMLIPGGVLGWLLDYSIFYSKGPTNVIILATWLLLLVPVPINPLSIMQGAGCCAVWPSGSSGYWLHFLSGPAALSL